MSWQPRLKGVVAAALIVRFGLLFVHHFAFKLVPGRGDAYRFYRYAANFSESGFFGALQTFDPSTAYGYSSILGAIFAITGPDWVVAECFNILISLILVVLTVRIAWLCGADKRHALLAGYIVALNPFTAQYGVVVLREMLVVLPLMIGLVALLKRSSPQNYTGVVFCAVGIFVAALFHGSMVVGLGGIVLGLYLAQQGIGGARQNKRMARQGVVLLSAVVGLAIAVPYLLESDLSKIGAVGDENFVAQVNEQVGSAARGGSAYLENYSASGPAGLILTAPLRVFYFLYSPLPWDVRAFDHVLGMLDAALYAWITIVLWKAFRAKVFEQKSQVLVGIMAFFVLAFSFGTSNAGTAIRHRAKFNYALVAVACALRYRLEEQKQMQRRQLAARRPALGAFATDSRT